MKECKSAKTVFVAHFPHPNPPSTDFTNTENIISRTVTQIDGKNTYTQNKTERR